MFTILFSNENSNQSAVNACASVAHSLLHWGRHCDYQVCETKYFLKQAGTSMANPDVLRLELLVAAECYRLLQVNIATNRKTAGSRGFT
jgi:hypothetical protein